MSDDGAAVRADAQANRDRILAAARGVLADDPEAAFSAVARAAGVGQATLYRHFPSREALLVGVYRKEVDALVELAPALLAEQPPLAALRTWCARFAQVGEVKHGLAETLRATISDEEFRQTYAPLAAAVGRLMTACQAAGEVRPDVLPDDVLTLLSCVLRLPPTSDGRRAVTRVLELIFRSLA